MNHPNENRTQSSLVLVEEFQKKGYQCTKMVDEEATIIIFKHEKKKEHHDSSIVDLLSPSSQNFLAN